MAAAEDGVEPVSARGDVDGTVSRRFRHRHHMVGALLEVRDEHDGSGDDDRASCRCRGDPQGRETQAGVGGVDSSIGTERDDGRGLSDAIGESASGQPADESRLRPEPICILADTELPIRDDRRSDAAQ